MLQFSRNRINCIYFCMCFTELLVVTFTNNFVGMDNHTTHHGIGRNMAYTFNGKVETALHVVFVIIQASAFQKALNTFRTEARSKQPGNTMNV